MIAQLEGATVEQKMESYEFKMYFLTQHKLYEGRDIEMVSDMKLIATDFLIWLRQTKFQYFLTIEENITMTDFNHSFNDDCCGFYFTLRVKQFLDWDLCRIPMDGYTPPDNNSVKVYDQDGNLLYTLYPGQTLTVELLKEIVDSITNNNSTVIETLT